MREGTVFALTVLGCAARGSRGARNSWKMFSIAHLEYFFGFGMFILGMTKVRPAPSRRSHRPNSKKFLTRQQPRCRYRAS